MVEKSVAVIRVADKQCLESINNSKPFGAHTAVLHVPSARQSYKDLMYILHGLHLPWVQFLLSMSLVLSSGLGIFTL